MALPALPLVQGTLDLLVLRTLASGARHGYGIASVVHELTAGDLSIEDAALYQALHRLDRQGLVEARVAAFREQPARALLRAHARRTAPAQGGDGGLAPLLPRRRSRARGEIGPHARAASRAPPLLVPGPPPPDGGGRDRRRAGAPSRDAGRGADRARGCRRTRRDARRCGSSAISKATRRYCRQEDERKERRMQRWLVLDDVVQDLRMSLRGLRRAPLMTADDRRHGRPRHRRHDRDLRRGPRGAAPPAPVRRAGAARAHLHRRAAEPLSVLGRRLPRAAGAADAVRADRRLHRASDDLQRRRRRGAGCAAASCRGRTSRCSASARSRAATSRSRTAGRAPAPPSS